MADLGYISLILALVASLVTAIACFAGGRARQETPGAGRIGLFLTFGLVSLASAVLVFSVLVHNFSLEYVAEYSSIETPWPYLLSAWWAGNAGSLLFWAWALSLFAVIFITRRRHSEFTPYAAGITMLTEAFFLLLLVVVSNPFTKLAVPPADGRGLNPLLENAGMIFHPPALLAGYVALTIPFAIAMAALLGGNLDKAWTIAARRWTLAAWLLLSVGNVIGAWWAYVELGWGGYWAWDPVENAGLMPWLVATAFLHSAMVQRRRGMFKVWNMALIMLAFIISIFGTYVTRSGILNSVHSFGDLGLGPYFTTFIILAIAVSLGLLVYRRNELKSDAEIDATVSRESAFLLNNLLLVGSTFIVLLGTVFPALSELFTGQKVEVGAAFFNMVNGPLYLGLILLAGTCILIGWKRKTMGELGRSFLRPLIIAIVISGSIFALGVRQAFAVIAFFIASLVFALIVQQWISEVRERRKARSEGYFSSFLTLFGGNRARYGGYIVHLAIVLMAIGVAGSSFYGVSKEIALTQGQSVEFEGYKLTFDNMGHSGTNARFVVGANMSVYRGDKLIGQMVPEKFFNENYEQPVSEVAIRSTLLEDLYVILLGWDQNGSVAFKILVNPMVGWIWVGGVLLAAGGLIAFWPASPARIPVPVEGAAAFEAEPAAITGKGRRFCPRCGARHKEGDRFCPRCGASLQPGD